MAKCPASHLSSTLYTPVGEIREQIRISIINVSATITNDRPNRTTNTVKPLQYGH